ncbi:MAG: type secretion target repeat protein [Nocardioides sp.]|jgi:Ca2+-binding RTX toxin-like protein|nr:type secretion target repeat protein [Nocardioides sp.]
MGTRRTTPALGAVLAALTFTGSAWADHAGAGDGATTSYDDHLHGTKLGDVIHGHQGADRINGRRGPDRLFGGSGDDRLDDHLGVGTGGPLDTARDVYRGGPGDDTLMVGHHDDVRAGRGRDDVWAFYVGEGDFVDCGPGEDTLHLHQDLDGIETRGCETILIRIAG